MAQPSKSVVKTDAPIVEKMRNLSKPGVASLAQGIVHWAPPNEAVEAAAAYRERILGAAASWSCIRACWEVIAP